MLRVAALLCVLGAAFALPQIGVTPTHSQFGSSAPAVAPPSLVQRTEQSDEAGQFTRSYQLSDGTTVQETGTLKLNIAGDGLVLVTRGYFRYPTPLGEFWETEWVADENGYQVLRSNALPVAPTAVPPTF